VIQTVHSRDHAFKWNASVMWGRMDPRGSCDHSKDAPRLGAARQQSLLKVVFAWHYEP